MAKASARAAAQVSNWAEGLPRALELGWPRRVIIGFTVKTNTWVQFSDQCRWHLHRAAAGSTLFSGASRTWTGKDTVLWARQVTMQGRVLLANSRTSCTMQGRVLLANSRTSWKTRIEVLKVS